MNVIAFENVSFSYDGRPVLEEVNLNIEAGDFVSIVGPNGGGKTTLLKLILGLRRPDRGRIRVFDQPPRQARRRVGYTPQHLFYDPHFPVTAMDVVLMGRLEGDFGWRYTATDREVARRALEEVEASDLAGRTFDALSGGQRQRVLVARALASEPEVLLLDEPIANIDPAVGSRLLEILQRLNERMTILMASHDLGFVSGFVKSVVCVNRRVLVHPTSAITGEIIQEIYGGDLRMIRHDHRCAAEGHSHG